MLAATKSAKIKNPHYLSGKNFTRLKITDNVINPFDCPFSAFGVWSLLRRWQGGLPPRELGQLADGLLAGLAAALEVAERGLRVAQGQRAVGASETQLGVTVV